MNTEDRVAQLESAFVTLTQLVRGHAEQLDTQRGWINQLGTAHAELTAAQAELTAAQAELTAAQANSEHKIAALVDAQIHTEDELRKLAEQGAQANVRLDRLAVMVERLMEGRNGQG
jgi:multidrug resistance efflux pump